MNAAHETGGTPVTTPTTAAARLFEAELAHQRIAPDNATSTVALLTEDLETRGEGFVTVEAARMLVAKILRQVDETVNDPLLPVVAHEIAPDEAPAPCPHRCMQGKHCGGCGCPGCGYSSAASTAFEPPPGYDVYGPGSDYDDNGNWRAAPPLNGTWS